jgi:hypothetical protein
VYLEATRKISLYRGCTVPVIGVIQRVRRLLSTSVDEKDQRVWYGTTRMYVAEIRRSCTEALPETEEPEDSRRFRTEAERGAKIVGARKGAGPRVGASEELLNEMEELEEALREAGEGHADAEELLRRLEEVEDRLGRECP